MLRFRKKEWLFLAVIVLCYVILLLFLSEYTSPLYPYSYGYDSALFSLLGKGIVNGKELYVDLFDHKGPILFFIEALGQLMGDRVGIFTIQCLFGAANIIFSFAIFKLIRKNYSTLRLRDYIAVVISGYSLFFYSFSRGNLTEEYSLPIISLCIMLLVKYAIGTKENKKHPYSYSFVYGICFAILSMIRINNAVPICAGVLVVVVYLIYKREFKNLFLNILSGLLGCVALCIPIFIYFAVKSSLYEMLYATFIYNFKYAANIGHSAIFSNYFKMYCALYSPLLVALILVVVRIVKAKKAKTDLLDILIASVVLFTLISLLNTNTYPHYFTIGVPAVMLAVSRYYTVKIKSLKTLLLLWCIILNVLFVQSDINYYTLGLKEEGVTEYQTIKTDMGKIPKSERDSVIGYEVLSEQYLIGDIIPCYKYYTQQSWWAIGNPQILTEFFTWLDTEKPLWLITKTDAKNETLQGIVVKNYELQFEDDYLKYYRIKDEIKGQ